MLKAIYKVWPGVREVPGVIILSHVDMYMFEREVFMYFVKRHTICRVFGHDVTHKMYDTICDRCRVVL